MDCKIALVTGAGSGVGYHVTLSGRRAQMPYVGRG
jgi:NADP-dependent 3-hydroxy acid dehydrogenase YdfG